MNVDLVAYIQTNRVETNILDKGACCIFCTFAEILCTMLQCSADCEVNTLTKSVVVVAKRQYFDGSSTVLRHSLTLYDYYYVLQESVLEINGGQLS